MFDSKIANATHTLSEQDKAGTAVSKLQMPTHESFEPNATDRRVNT